MTPEQAGSTTLTAEWVTDVDDPQPGYPDRAPDKWITMLGGDSSNPTWDEYLNGFVPEAHPELEAIRECVTRNGLIGKLADEVANHYHFKLSNGVRRSFSWRAWGDLMQAIVGKREGYMRYYM